MDNALTTQPKQGLVTRFAERFAVDPDKLLATLKATAFRQKDDAEITTAQMMALLVVADQYGLNPFTKEIFAFESKGAIIPVVSVDGWSRIINDNPKFNGLEFAYSDNIVTPNGGKPCPEWCEVIIHRKDRDVPIRIREYLDEVYIPPRKGKSKFGKQEEYVVDGPWQSHTKRFLRHKTLIQGARIAFGFAGIHDEDEAYRIIQGEAVRVNSPVLQGQPALDAAARTLTHTIGAGPMTVGDLDPANWNEGNDHAPVQDDRTGDEEGDRGQGAE